MNIYPIITTPAPRDCRDFYVRVFDAKVLYDSEWFVHIAVMRWELAFLSPNPPVRLPLFQHSSLSRGLCLAIEVEDVKGFYERLKRRGIEALGLPQQSSTGELAFSVMDPAGVILNVVEVKAEPSQVVEL